MKCKYKIIFASLIVYVRPMNDFCPLIFLVWMTGGIKSDSNSGRRLFSLDGLLMAFESGKLRQEKQSLLSLSANPKENWKAAISYYTVPLHSIKLPLPTWYWHCASIVNIQYRARYWQYPDAESHDESRCHASHVTWCYLSHTRVHHISQAGVGISVRVLLIRAINYP